MADPCPWCRQTPCAKTCDAGRLPAYVYWLAGAVAALLILIVVAIVSA